MSRTSHGGTPYWLEERRSEWPSTRVAGRADVAVIGGGVTGCSCALTLASNGVRVRLHEAREIAGGASGRNGGFALRGATLPYGPEYGFLRKLPPNAIVGPGYTFVPGVGILGASCDLPTSACTNEYRDVK